MEKVIRQTYTISEEEQARLDNNFRYHAPVKSQTDRYELLRSQAKKLAELYCQMCPRSRELSLALTHLEEAMMWANAAIARNEGGTPETDLPVADGR